MQSDGIAGGSGTPALLHAFNCSTDKRGARMESFGDDCWIVTEIPANEFGDGTFVALCGFVGSIVKPETKIVVICPGDTRMLVELAYPAPTKVVPWPKSREKGMKKMQLQSGRFRRIHSSLMYGEIEPIVEGVGHKAIFIVSSVQDASPQNYL
jgi:hypothetical protein